MKMTPVAVWEGNAVRRTLTSVEDAALFLLHRWPPRDKGRIAAQIAVLAALEGKGTVEDARAAFVEAAERAGVLAGEEERTSVTLPGHIARPWDFRQGKRRR